MVKWTEHIRPDSVKDLPLTKPEVASHNEPAKRNALQGQKHHFQCICPCRALGFKAKS